MLASADRIVTSTEAWRDQWQARMPQFREKISCACSPSTIPVVPLPDVAAHRQQWRQSLGWSADTLVLGWFGTASAAKQLAWVIAARERAAKETKQPVAVILIGKAEELAQAEQSPLIKSTGYLAASAVSHVLQSIDALLLPFIDGVSERRTSFMAGLSHATPVVTTHGHNTGPTLRTANICRLASALEENEFTSAVAQLLADPAARQTLGERGRDYYRQHYDWPVVVRHFVTLAQQEVSRA